MKKNKTPDTPQPPGQERRKFRRIPMEVSIDISPAENERISLKGYIKDISEGGMALEMFNRLEPQKQLKLNFTLPNGNTFDLLGKIIYAKKGVLTIEYGVDFRDVNPEDQQKLRSYAAAKAKKK